MSVEGSGILSSVLSEKALAFSVDSILGKTQHRKFVDTCNENLQKSDRNGAMPHQKIQMKLCKRDLWCKFHRFGNEMILTKTGRRIFPPLQVEVFNLLPDCYYIIWVEILPMDTHRYKYVFTSSQWMIAGKCDPPFPNNRYYHPDGAATGKHWMSRPISLDKLKLTNNKHPIQKDQMTLRSMHKYQPRIHVQLVNGPGHQRSVMDTHISEAFTFPETSFITVTAYQNQEITRLKIECNRFAKGFRERTSNRNTVGNNGQETENHYNFGTSAFTPIIRSVNQSSCWCEALTSRQALEPTSCSNTCLPSCRCLPHCCPSELCVIDFYRQYVEETSPTFESSLQSIQLRTRNKINYHPYILRAL